ncbi:TerD family protein, partial [Acinetobacter sp. 251-1]
MQLIAGGNIGLTQQNVDILIKTNVPAHIDLDITAYQLAQTTQKVRGDQDMIFYGQKQTINQSVILTESSSKAPYQSKLSFNTALIDPQIGKIAICATLNEPHAVNRLAPIQIELQENGQTVATAIVETQQKTEKALILAEVYKHNEKWKFRFVNQGFNGGLKPLAENFGVEIAAETTQAT